MITAGADGGLCFLVCLVLNFTLVHSRFLIRSSLLAPSPPSLSDLKPGGMMIFGPHFSSRKPLFCTGVTSETRSKTVKQGKLCFSGRMRDKSSSSLH